MERESTDYRLERWIALFLFLLFFLPFVAQAQPAPLALVCNGETAWLQHATTNLPADAWLLNDRRLDAGTIARSTCDQVPAAAPMKLTFNGEESTLHYRCGEADDAGIVECVLLLDEQPLAKRVAFEGEELKVLVSFAGDLDRDGRLDLLVDVARNRYQWKPALFLSSAATRGQLVAKVAEVSQPESDS